jgi:hypothetical protein
VRLRDWAIFKQLLSLPCWIFSYIGLMPRFPFLLPLNSDIYSSVPSCKIVSTRVIVADNTPTYPASCSLPRMVRQGHQQTALLFNRVFQPLIIPAGNTGMSYVSFLCTLASTMMKAPPSFLSYAGANHESLYKHVCFLREETGRS